MTTNRTANREARMPAAGLYPLAIARNGEPMERVLRLANA